MNIKQKTALFSIIVKFFTFVKTNKLRFTLNLFFLSRIDQIEKLLLLEMADFNNSTAFQQQQFT